MDSVDPKAFTARLGRTATINADDFKSASYGEPWDGELYWGMFLWELGLLEREPKRQFIPHHVQDPYQGERNDFQEHHFGLYDRDWQTMQTVRSIKVVPAENPDLSRRGTAMITKQVFDPQAFARIVDELLEVPGTNKVLVRQADVAESIVEALLENEFDFKSLAVRAGDVYNPLRIVADAYNAILALPWDDQTDAWMQNFHREKGRIITDMIKQLEQATGRVALNGTDGLMSASAPNPWNHERGYKISPKYTRELLASFRACSKPVKK